HHGAIAGDALRMEGRRRKATLPMPGFTLAGEEPLAEDRLHMPEEQRKLDEVAVISHQHVFGIIGVVQEHRGPGAEPERDDITILARPLLVVAQYVAPQLKQVAEERKPLRTGRPARRAANGRWRSHLHVHARDAPGSATHVGLASGSTNRAQRRYRPAA